MAKKSQEDCNKKKPNRKPAKTKGRNHRLSDLPEQRKCPSREGPSTVQFSNDNYLNANGLNHSLRPGTGFGKRIGGRVTLKPSVGGIWSWRKAAGSGAPSWPSARQISALLAGMNG